MIKFDASLGEKLTTEEMVKIAEEEGYEFITLIWRRPGVFGFPVYGFQNSLFKMDRKTGLKRVLEDNGSANFVDSGGRFPRLKAIVENTEQNRKVIAQAMAIGEDDYTVADPGQRRDLEELAKTLPKDEKAAKERKMTRNDEHPFAAEPQDAEEVSIRKENVRLRKEVAEAREAERKARLRAVVNYTKEGLEPINFMELKSLAKDKVPLHQKITKPELIDALVAWNIEENNDNITDDNSAKKEGVNI